MDLVSADCVVEYAGFSGVHIEAAVGKLAQRLEIRSVVGLDQHLLLNAALGFILTPYLDNRAHICVIGEQ